MPFCWFCHEGAHIRNLRTCIAVPQTIFKTGRNMLIRILNQQEQEKGITHPKIVISQKEFQTYYRNLATVDTTEYRILFPRSDEASADTDHVYHNRNKNNKMSRDVTKPAKWVCAQRRLKSAWASAKSYQILRCAQWVAKGPRFLHVDSEDSDQTGRMPRLIWVFAGRTCSFIGFVTSRLKFIFNNMHWNRITIIETE